MATKKGEEMQMVIAQKMEIVIANNYEITLTVSEDIIPEKKNLMTALKGNSCHLCNAERIKSRFEILDL